MRTDSRARPRTPDIQTSNSTQLTPDIESAKTPSKHEKFLILNIIGRVFIKMALNIGMPLALYYGLKDKVGNTYALLIGWFRTGAILSFVTGEARILLVRESFGLVFTSVLFLASIVPFRWNRFHTLPLTYSISKQAYDILNFKESGMFASAVWGVGLILEFGVKLTVIFLLPLDQAVNTSSIISAVFLASLCLITVIIWKRGSPKVKAEMAPNEEKLKAEEDKENGTQFKSDVA
ncbi:uncharacterized protein VTP21DRAFT_2621 [Calcarisporiella thermophila]|uniref:uncharacterized protein n=1 Tax=Calcarisporiella thermophila TaxID=911321 RepID=UPI003742ED31